MGASSHEQTKHKSITADLFKFFVGECNRGLADAFKCPRWVVVDILMYNMTLHQR